MGLLCHFYFYIYIKIMDSGNHRAKQHSIKNVTTIRLLLPCI